METITITFKAPQDAVDLFATKRAGYQATITDDEGVESPNPVNTIDHSKEFVTNWLLREMEKAMVQDATEKAKAQASTIKETIINAQ